MACAIGLAGVLLVGITPASTHAHAKSVFACEVTGATTELTPPIAQIPNTGGRGSFDVSAAAACGASIRSLISIDSTGTYINKVCGTGSVHGVASFSRDIGSIGYTVDFVAGQGTLTVTSGGSGHGIIDITPTNTGGCITAPATGFTLRGYIAIEE